MKTLTNFIQEKLHINKYKNNELKPSEIEGPLTPGIDYNDDEIVIFGKPFKSLRDKNYKDALLIAKKYDFDTSNNDFGSDDDLIDNEIYWILGGNKNQEVYLYSYDKNGAIGYKNMKIPFNL